LEVAAETSGDTAFMTRVLVVNTGSSSLKWTVLTSDKQVLRDANEPWSSDERNARVKQIRTALTQAPAFDVIGHRVVHGGTLYRDAVLIDADVRAQLGRLASLAPEHMECALEGIDAAQSAFPGVAQVAVFDTAFHATLGEAAAGYGLPFEWTERFGIRRFGFHGLSVAHAVVRSGEILGAVPERLLVCHLGNGSSITAVKGGRSIDTTMGFSPLEGVMMGTRSGSVDPGVLLYLQEHCGVDVGELRETLTSRSGLRGVSGISGDLRQVLAAAERGNVRAELAYDRFVHLLRRGLGSMLGVLHGVDAIAFTGGVGENSARVRSDVTRAFDFCGVELNEAVNAVTRSDGLVSTSGSRVSVLVLRSREDLAVLAAVLGLRPGA